MYYDYSVFSSWRQALSLIVDFIYVLSVVNIGATALVTEAATAIFGEAGVSAATGVMTVCMDLSEFVNWESHSLQ